MKRFVVNVADLLHRPGARRRETRSGRIDALAVSGSAVAPGAEVTVDTMLEWVTDGVLATGTVSTSWEGECRRCLVPVTGELRVEFRELFEHHPREGETFPLRHEHLDLEPLAREAVLVELPLAPLCQEACRGLCPNCGADLNRSACDCAVEVSDPRWAALDALKEDGGAS